MVQFNIAEAKAHLPELIEKVLLGEEVIIAKHNKPVAKIIPLRPAHRKPGTAKGQIRHPWIELGYSSRDAGGEHR